MSTDPVHSESSGHPLRNGWRQLVAVLRREPVGGILLLTGAVVALVWANSPWSGAYTALREFTIGPESLNLHLTLEQWASDGLLAIFFFVVGLELKHEFVAGDLRDPRRAALPVVAALGGVLMPALIYVAINFGDSAALQGWAIPTATDIAFAVSVLAILGRFLPSALRTFLLTLAVVDDLVAITIIAVFYTEDLEAVPLLLALIPLGLFTVLVQRRIRAWWLLLPLALVTWGLVHVSGVHSTVAGVLLGFAVPTLTRRGETTGLTEQFDHTWSPVSSGVAVPLFAFMAAGVSIGGLGGLATALTDSVAIGIIAGLVLGKLIGISGSTFLMVRFAGARLGGGTGWSDVLGLALLGGIGFTVSLLVGDLAFGVGSERDEHVKIAVLTGSLLSALLATVVLRVRNRTFQRAYEQESADSERGGNSG